MKKGQQTFIRVFGTLIALVGIEHGTGELLQGPIRPESRVIHSWPESGFFRALDGEPAFTLLPDLLSAGMATYLVSFAILAVIWLLPSHKRIGLMLIGLSALLFSVGGGFGPPLLGVILGLSVSFSSRRHKMQALKPSRFKAFLAGLWPVSLTACVAAFLVLMPGLPLLDTFLGIVNPTLVAAAFFTAMAFLAITIMSVHAEGTELEVPSPFMNKPVEGNQ